MERPLLQLVMSHPATDKRLFPRRAPSWAMDISRLSDAQLRSIHAFTQFAINNLRGVEGRVDFGGNQISKTAFRVATDYPNTGVGVFGGMSEEERRQQRFEAAEATEERLRNMLDRRGVPTGTSRVRGEAQTDGGRVVEQEK